MSRALGDLELSEQQKGNMETFLDEKRKICEQGEMKEQHLVRQAELGFGNGGVVLKVLHKPTGIIMARKVSNPVQWRRKGHLEPPIIYSVFRLQKSSGAPSKSCENIFLRH